MAEYRTRVVEALIHRRLRTHGAVVVNGPKAVGKSTTARRFAASEVRLDQDRAALAAARTDPGLVLDGPRPRLIDEYQLAEGMWDAVRGRVDDEGDKGLFLLTGSATPEDEPERHSGARRIARIVMRTMSLFERGLSTGDVSIGALLQGEKLTGGAHAFTVRDAAQAMVVGGWPDNLDLDIVDALDANRDYLDVIVNVDVQRVDGKGRDPHRVRQLLTSYSRNVATDASLRTIGRMSSEPPSEPTLHDYLGALGRLFLIEDQESWSPRLRSRVRLAATPRRHLCDPSLAVAALEATPERLLGPEIEWAGFLFESLVVHDLRVYAEPHRGRVRFYRDNKGLEVDAIVETPAGEWIGIEVKFGHHRADEAAETLLALRSKLAEEVNDQCRALMVVVADSPTYTRDDGVIVTSVASLGP